MRTALTEEVPPYTQTRELYYKCLAEGDREWNRHLIEYRRAGTRAPSHRQHPLHVLALTRAARAALW